LRPPRYETRDWSCEPERWKFGIAFPGLKYWESTTQRER
jgi:hypothetical protein